jgi:FkbM family methyltransferase
MTGERQYFSLNDLDRKLERFVDFDGGTIFEAGANNGITQSNSLYLERYRGWRSVLVEPIPQKYFDCVQNRPDALVEWAALVPSDWKDDWVPLTYCNLMTVTRGTPQSKAWEDEHLLRGVQFIPGEQMVDFRARARTISAILNKHRIAHVDVLSLDIEGFELSALGGLDLEQHRPTYLLIEVRDNEAMDSYLDPYYERVENLSHHDVLYRCRRALPRS